MTPRAQGDEIVFGVTSAMASQNRVVHLQCLFAAAKLASPAISLQNLQMECVVRVVTEPHSSCFREHVTYQALPVISDKNMACWSEGNKL